MSILIGHGGTMESDGFETMSEAEATDLRAEINATIQAESYADYDATYAAEAGRAAQDAAWADYVPDDEFPW